MPKPGHVPPDNPYIRPHICGLSKNRFMAIQRQKKEKLADPAKDAQWEAEKDIQKDPDFEAGGPTDDLDEGELARKDNSDEQGLDALEKERPRGGAHSGGAHGGEAHGGEQKRPGNHSGGQKHPGTHGGHEKRSGSSGK